MKIVSFGDSFIFGSELQDNNDGSRAWPGLIAQRIGAEYETLAIPGCGNDAIARQILQYFSENSTQDTLAVINWTWAIRWDFYIVAQEKWVTLGPTCVPSKLEDSVGIDEASRIIDFYNDYTGHSTLWENYRSLQAIFSTQCFLDAIGANTIETCMDYGIFDKQFHAPGYIQVLQDRVRPRMKDFEGQNFLDWCRDRGYPITEPGWHPVEPSHEAAADLWAEIYHNKLKEIG
jgi:hypothetical protein